MRFKKPGLFNIWTIDSKDYDLIVKLTNELGIKTVLEFGPGVSTFAFLENNCSVVAYESQKRWHDVAKKKFSQHDVDVRMLLNHSKVFNNTYDLVFVDGIRRQYFSWNARKHTRNILIHDANRPGERKAINKLKDLGWKVKMWPRGRGMALLRK
jgi:predicted O-methyltransferase YrrM